MKQYIILGVLVFLFGSCDSFLKEYSQDLAYAETITDLEEVLIGIDINEEYCKIGIRRTGISSFYHGEELVN